MAHHGTIVELRRYALHPGARDTLIEIFAREFVAGQRALGIEILGWFRDLDDPDCFFWVRAFAERERRGAALAAFYGGPVWKAHRDAANATMIDSSNVLQLRPVKAGAIDRDGTIVATICYLRAPADDALIATFERAIVPQIRAEGGELLATFVTDPSENPFPPLPIREGVSAFVWFARHASPEAARPDLATFAPAMLGIPEVHRLARP